MATPATRRGPVPTAPPTAVVRQATAAPGMATVVPMLEEMGVAVVTEAAAEAEVAGAINLDEPPSREGTRLKVAG